MGIDLLNRFDWTVATVDVLVEGDTVTMGVVDWTAAVLHRESLRDWLREPKSAFKVQEVEWSRQGDKTFLKLAGSIPYPISNIVVSQLMELI